MFKDELKERVKNDHEYHSPTGDKASRHENIREAAEIFACLVIDNVPEGRELSSALSKIEEAAFWANAGIARNE